MSYERGAGSPGTDDAGAGDPPWDMSGTGAGDPFSVQEAGMYFSLFAQAVPSSSDWFSPTRTPSDGKISQEGGWLIELRIPGMDFVDGTYRVDLVNDWGIVWPNVKPGCNSALFGRKYACRPAPGGKYMRFASPAAPVDTYRVKVTFPTGEIVYSENTVDLTYVPECPQFRSLAALPEAVYRVISPIKDPV
jgi:hypothetical protein